MNTWSIPGAEMDREGTEGSNQAGDGSQGRRPIWPMLFGAASGFLCGTTWAAFTYDSRAVEAGDQSTFRKGLAAMVMFTVIGLVVGWEVRKRYWK